MSPCAKKNSSHILGDALSKAKDEQHLIEFSQAADETAAKEYEQDMTVVARHYGLPSDVENKVFVKLGLGRDGKRG